MEKTLGSPLECKEIQPVHSEGDQPFDCFGRNDAKAETSVLWLPHEKSWLTGKYFDAGRDLGQKKKATNEDEMAGWHHWLDGCKSEWTLGVGDGQGGLVCCDSWGRKESKMTEQLNWTELKGWSRLQGSRTRAWAKGDSTGLWTPGEASGSRGDGTRLLRFWRTTLCRFMVHRENKVESNLEVVAADGWASCLLEGGMWGRGRDPGLLPCVVPGACWHQTKHVHGDDHCCCRQRVYTGMCLHLRGQAISKLHWPCVWPVQLHMFLLFFTEHSFPRGLLGHRMLGFL